MANYNYTVTVAYSGYHYQNIYRLNGTDKPALTVAVGDTVTFDLSDSTVTGHPLLISPNNSNSGAYVNTDGVIYTVTGTNYTGASAFNDFVNAFNTAKNSNSSAAASVTWTVASSNDISSFYVCNYHSNMGNTITVTGGTDTDAPTNTSISINSGAANTTSTSVTLTLAATDNVGVTGYFKSNTNSTPGPTDAGWTGFSAVTPYSASGIAHTLSAGAGTKTVYAWFKDAGNRISTVTSDTINLLSSDTTIPTNGTISIAGGASTTSSTTVSVAISATDNIGVTGYYLNESSSTPSAGSFTPVSSATSFSTTVNFNLSSGDGLKQVYVWFIDAAFNISSAYSDTITLATSDTTAPASVAISLNSGAASTTSLTVTAAISGTDAVGVTGYYLSESSSTPSAGSFTTVASATSFSLNVNFNLSSGNGTKTVYVWLRDAAGNISSPANDTITLALSGSGDLIAPVVSSLTILEGASVSSRSVTVRMVGTDAVGVTGYFLSESSTTPALSAFTMTGLTETSFTRDTVFVLSASAGTKTIYCWLRDGTDDFSGNISTPSAVNTNLLYSNPGEGNFKIRESIIQSSLPGFATARTLPSSTNTLVFGPVQVSNTLTVNGTLLVMNELNVVEGGVVNNIGIVDVR